MLHSVRQIVKDDNFFACNFMSRGHYLWQTVINKKYIIKKEIKKDFLDCNCSFLVIYLTL